MARPESSASVQEPVQPNAVACKSHGRNWSNEGEMDKPRIIGGELNTALSIINRTRSQEIRKDTELKNTINQLMQWILVEQFA